MLNLIPFALLRYLRESQYSLYLLIIIDYSTQRKEFTIVWCHCADHAPFQQPVPLGVELTARGHITKTNRRLFEGTGELYLPDGTVAVRATGKYVKMTLDGIADVDAQTLGWQVYAD